MGARAWASFFCKPLTYVRVGMYNQGNRYHGGMLMARRLKKDALETRARLLESALDIMSEKAFPNVTMKEIAERVGMSKGAIYWHFKNKDDVLLSLIEDIWTRFNEEFTHQLASLKSLDDMHGYFREKMQGPSRNEWNRKISRLMLRQQEWPAEIRERVCSIVRGRMERERQRIEELLSAAVDEGSIRKDLSPEDLAMLISVTFQGIFLYRLRERSHADFSKHVDFILNAFRKEMESPSSAK